MTSTVEDTNRNTKLRKLNSLNARPARPLSGLLAICTFGHLSWSCLKLLAIIRDRRHRFYRETAVCQEIPYVISLLPGKNATHRF